MSNNIQIKKYRKLLTEIKDYIREKKKDLSNNKPKKKLTDFERGRCDGMHRAYNDIMQHIGYMIDYADIYWKNTHCRDENYEYKPVITQSNGPKFKVGEKVCAVGVCVDTNNLKVHVKCDTCDSTGKVRIVGKNGEYTCPVCHGEIVENPNKYVFKIIYVDATIGRIEYTEYSNKYKCKGKKFDTVSKYLLEETGVEGGGMIWFEQQLFATEKAAQEFCDKYIPTTQSHPDAFKDPLLKT